MDDRLNGPFLPFPLIRRIALRRRQHAGYQAERENKPYPSGAGYEEIARLFDLFGPFFTASLDRRRLAG
jgi:hypothetical protein